MEFDDLLQLMLGGTGRAESGSETDPPRAVPPAASRDATAMWTPERLQNDADFDAYFQSLGGRMQEASQAFGATPQPLPQLGGAPQIQGPSIGVAPQRSPAELAQMQRATEIAQRPMTMPEARQQLAETNPLDVGKGLLTGDYPTLPSAAMGSMIENIPGIEQLAGAREVGIGLWGARPGQSAEEAREGLQRAGMGALAALPLVPALRPGMSAAARNVGRQITEEIGEAGRALTTNMPFPGRIQSPLPTQTPMPTRVLPRRTASNPGPERIRAHASPDEMMAAAQRGDHLIEGDQGIIAGSPGIRNRRELNRIRREYDAKVAEGAVEGAMWYRRARNANLRAMGAGQQQQLRWGGTQAVTSMQATPEVNLGFSLRSRAGEMATGGQAPMVRTPLQQQKVQEIIDEVAHGADIEGLGPKMGKYGLAINPVERQPFIPVNDIQQGRAWGFGDEWSRGFGEAQHNFLDGETLLATERANRNKLLGRTDWTPEEIQASAWVSAKATSLQSQFPNRFPKTPVGRENALKEAAKGYADAFEKHSAYITREATPGVGTGHLPLIPGSREVQAGYSGHPAMRWETEDMRDAILQGTDQPHLRPRETIGSFEGEVSPGNATPVLVGRDKSPGMVEVSPGNVANLNATAAAQGFMDAQNSAAWHYFIPEGEGVAAANLNGLRVSRGDLTHSQMQALDAYASSKGFYTSNTGDGVTFIPKNPSDNVVRKAARQMEADVQQLLGDPNVSLSRGRIQSSYIPLFEGTGPRRYLGSDDAVQTGATESIGHGTKLRNADGVVIAKIDNENGMGAMPLNRNIGYQGFAIDLTPAEFGSLNPTRPRAPTQLVQGLDEGKDIASPTLFVNWDDEAKAWYITQHEGRGRMLALGERGVIDRVPVHVVPRNMKARDLTPEMLDAPIHPDRKSARTAPLTTETVGRGGGGQATQRMLDAMDDPAAATLLSQADPNIRAAAADRLKVYGRLGPQLGGVNQGLMQALEILAKDGLDGLRRAMKNPAIRASLPAVVAVLGLSEEP